MFSTTPKKCGGTTIQRGRGVRDVANELEIKILDGFERSDEDILEAADRALAWCYPAPKYLTGTDATGGCEELRLSIRMSQTIYFTLAP